MFNVVDTATGWKVDLIVRKSRPFSHAEFARRRPIDADGLSLHVASLEDLIVAKLEWAKLGGSARQLEDVATMVRVAGTAIAHDYLNHWIDALELHAQWRVIREGQDTA
jgi:predicted nucleotidyltransferase